MLDKCEIPILRRRIGNNALDLCNGVIAQFAGFHGLKIDDPVSDKLGCATEILRWELVPILRLIVVD